MQNSSIKALCLKVFYSSLLLVMLVGVERVKAAGVEVGLVTQLQGKAVYWNEEDQKQPAQVQTFMKVQDGDHFKVPADSTLQLIYRDNGRQETWRGPVTLVAGTAESRPETGVQAAPKVESLPIEVTGAILTSSLPLPRSRVATAGVFQLRCSSRAAGAAALKEEDKQAIATARRIYEELRQTRGDKDLTPEIYLISVLADYEQYAEINKNIDKLLIEHPDSAMIKEWKNWNDKCLNTK